MTHSEPDMGVESPPPTGPAILVWIVNFSTAIAVAVMGLCILFSVLVVAARYGFARPIEGADEILGIAIGATMFAAYALVNTRRAHIQVDLINDAMLGPLAFWRDGLVMLAECIGFALIAYMLFQQAAYLQRSEYVYEFAPLPKASVAYSLAVLSALAAVSLFLPIWAWARRDPIPRPDREF